MSECTVTDGIPAGSVNGFVRQIAETNTEVSVGGAGSPGEEDVFSFTVPGGTLGPRGSLRFTQVGDLLNNTAGVMSVRWRVRIGAAQTVIYDATTPTYAQDPLRRAFLFRFMLVNRADNTVQIGGGQWGLSDFIVPTVGLGPFVNLSSTSTFGTPGLVSAIGAVDTSADWLFTVTAQLSANIALSDLRSQLAVLDGVFRG